MELTTRLFERKTKADWLKIRNEIIKEPTIKVNWEDASHLFRLRINTRYFIPIEQLLSLKLTTGEGFAVVSLMCSLIEFYQSAFEGKQYKHGATETDHVYGASGPKFKSFLTTHSPFKEVFSKNVPKPYDKITTYADDFYTNVRCGLLHEAATKNNWTIKTPKKSMRESDIFIDVSDDNNKIIYREIFFKVLKVYSENYLATIVTSTEQSIRNNFCRTLDSLCEIRNDKTVGWW